MYTVKGYAAFWRAWNGTKQHIDLTFYIPCDNYRAAEDIAWLYTHKHHIETFVCEIRQYDTRIEDSVLSIVSWDNGAVKITK